MPNKRKPGQTLLTFWIPEDEAAAAKEAVAALGTSISDECRRALRNAVKRAQRNPPVPPVNPLLAATSDDTPAVPLV